jgi:hypothetical protein
MTTSSFENTNLNRSGFLVFEMILQFKTILCFNIHNLIMATFNINIRDNSRREKYAKQNVKPMGKNLHFLFLYIH